MLTSWLAAKGGVGSRGAAELRSVFHVGVLRALNWTFCWGQSASAVCDSINLFEILCWALFWGREGESYFFLQLLFPLQSLCFIPWGLVDAAELKWWVPVMWQRCGTGGVVIYALAHAVLFSLLLSVLLMIYLAFIYLVYPESFLQSRYPPSRGWKEYLTVFVWAWTHKLKQVSQSWRANLSL